MDSFRFFILSLLPLYVLLPTACAQLRQNYYSNICPNVESIVCAAVTQKFQQTFVTAPATLRLLFHDCFVRGCDASVLLASPNGSAEKDHPDDVCLAGDGFDTVIKAKEAVDRDPRCQNKAGGPFYAVELGRRDGRISTKASVQCHLPQSSFHLDQLNAMFASHGLTQTDMIALSGFSHCSKFARRIYKFHSSRSTDPTVNPSYARQLQQMCPVNVDPMIAINMDPTTPQTFNNAYFRNLQQGMGLFTSDQTLFTDARSRGTVNLFACNNTVFQEAFVIAITKLGRVGVKTENQGEIRRDCTVVN